MKFIAIFDIPHIIKGLRNNNMEKDVKLPHGSIAQWKHYQIAFQLDSNSQKIVRALPRIKEGHVYKEKMKKMKVNVAAQVYSRSMASFIVTANSLGKFLNRNDIKYLQRTTNYF